MSNKLERRYAALQAEDDFVLEGYAATFGVESQDFGDWREIIMPGAFTRALREGQDIRCLRNHDPNYVLGRTKNGTLQCKEDTRGLFFRCILDPNNPDHVSTHSSVKRGDMDACSFAFVAKSQKWTEGRDADGNTYALRQLRDVDLQDTSVVTYPAYSEGTSVQARCFPQGEVAEIRSALDAFALRKAQVVADKCSTGEMDARLLNLRRIVNSVNFR